MSYKYKKYQLFSKKLPVPNEIIKKVYSKTLSLREYVEYELVDKVPSSCLADNYRMLVDKFGIEKVRYLDFEMLEKFLAIHLVDILQKIETDVSDLNEAITKSIIDSDQKFSSFIQYQDFYTDRMKKICPQYFITESIPENTKYSFYDGSLTIVDILKYWDVFKDKNLNFCLKRNNYIINQEQLHKFVKCHSDLLPILKNDEEEIIYNLIEKLCNDDLSDEETKDIIVDYIRDKVSSKHNSFGSLEEYMAAFSYISVENYVADKFGESYLYIFQKAIPDSNKIFDCGIPIDIVLSSSMISLLNYYSFEQLIEFNQKYDNILLEYSDFLEHISFRKYSADFTKEEIKKQIDLDIYEYINKYNFYYNEFMPKSFKNTYSYIFLPENTPNDLKYRFYNKKLTLDDFCNNSELLNYFDNTNFAFGLTNNLSWVRNLFTNDENIKMANYKRIKVLTAYVKINDYHLREKFKKFIQNNNYEIEKLDLIIEVFERLSNSNSTEITRIESELASQLLMVDNPIEYLNKIENIFLKNNIPTVGKIYSVFELLHPDLQDFDYSDNSTISPTLKKASLQGKKIIIFSDLIKSYFGSNNRNIKAYLANIEEGYSLYLIIKEGKMDYESLSNEGKKILSTFRDYLITLYNNTYNGQNNKKIIFSDEIIRDIDQLKELFSIDGTLDYNLADRVIKMFLHFSGINTLEEAKQYFYLKTKEADLKNRERANSHMKLSKGDLVKGIGDIKYLSNILQNGSVSKEFLGASADSDNTPLDTDVSMIVHGNSIERTAANGVGPIYVVLKNDERFNVTRTKEGCVENLINDRKKLELFYTGICDTENSEHYGIRTGFSSSDIDYIVVEHYDERVCLEVALNGFYIPIVNKEGIVLFTPKDYDTLRAKMCGLTHYGDYIYQFSENLYTPEINNLILQIDDNKKEIYNKKSRIDEVIRKSLEELDLILKTDLDGDLTEGYVELIDTGSTGRGTNIIGDGDFDFMMRIDRKVLLNPQKMEKLRSILLKNFGKTNSLELTDKGDLRLKNVNIGYEMLVDIDISFVQKNDKISYSTDMALKDRLSTIEKNDPEKYKYVVANIMMAKQILKQADVYKPNRGEVPQGGLGGVGIENWVLQNGGSFLDAAMDFLRCANGKSFDEFKESYVIWDFGENYLSVRNGNYSHDNFITNNMSEEGYERMKIVLFDYINQLYQNSTKNTNYSNSK